jgi:BlaI family penicillinase repressor
MTTQLLTPLELKIMNILWELKEGFVKDVLEKWDEKPLPAYNTISTKIRVLEDKGIVSHKAYGKTHQYFPVISKDDYQKFFIQNAIEKVFNGSVNGLINTLVDNKQLSADELHEIKMLIKKHTRK